MIKEIRYETPMKDVDFWSPTVFLAGPSVRASQKHLKSWRPDALKLFKQFGFDGNIIIPEFKKPVDLDTHFAALTPWEFEGLRKSTVIMFWLPRTKEMIGLTTNFELGYWIAKDRNSVVYGRPDGAYRIEYIDTMWVEDGKMSGDLDTDRSYPIYNTLEKTVKAVMEKIR